MGFSRKRRQVTSCSPVVKVSSTDPIWHGGRTQPGVSEKSMLGKQLLLFFSLILASMGLMMKGSIFDVYITFFNPETSAYTQNVTSKQKSTLKRELVIIVSAPASGFDAVEKDLIAWSKDYKIRPYSYVVPDISPTNYTKSKGCLQLIDAILTKVTSAPRGFDGYNFTKYMASDYLITEFQKEFNSLWMQNKNILIGSDHLSHFSSEKVRRKSLDRLLKMFPWNDARFSLPGTNNDAKVILLYRSSRMKHLQELWSSSASHVDFIEWLSSYDASNHVDIFSTTEVFTKKGLKVDVVDVDNIVDNGQNLTKYILCEVIGLPCQSDGPLKGLLDGNVEPTKFSVRNSSFDVQFDSLDAAMNEYECKFDFLRGKDVRFFPKSLAFKFSSCKVTSIERSDVSREIQNMAQQMKKKKNDAGANNVK